MLVFTSSRKASNSISKKFSILFPNSKFYPRTHLTLLKLIDKSKYLGADGICIISNTTTQSKKFKANLVLFNPKSSPIYFKEQLFFNQINIFSKPNFNTILNKSKNRFIKKLCELSSLQNKFLKDELYEVISKQNSFVFQSHKIFGEIVI